MTSAERTFLGVGAGWLGLLLATGALAAMPAHPADHAGHGGGAHESSWSEMPRIEATPGRDRSKAAFRIDNLSAGSVAVFAPGSQAPWPEGVRFKTDRVEWSLPVNAGRFNLEAGGVGNYHWLVAREETPEAIRVASTAHYFSNPGPAPTAMLARPKTELEIVPEPLPREHNRYRASQEWSFQVRFQGQPLAGTTVNFASSGGSRSLYTSDGRGKVRVVFPDDVAPAEAGGHAGHGGSPSNRFVLSVEHDAGGRHFLTAFNSSYSVDAYTDRSLAWGGGFLALGGLIGLPLVIRRKEKDHG